MMTTSVMPVLLLAVMGLLSSQVSGSVTCSIPSVAKGQTTSLTCDFGTDMRKDKSSISVERSSSETEDILQCHWNNKTEDYSCAVLDSHFSLSPNVSRYLKLFLPNADDTAEQKYLCKRHGHRDFPNVCQFTLTQDEEADAELVDEGWKTAAICLIVISIVLLVTNAIATFFARRYKRQLTLRNQKSYIVQLRQNTCTSINPPLTDICQIASQSTYTHGFGWPEER